MALVSLAMTDDDGIDGPHDAAWAAAEAEDRIDFAALTDPAPPEPDVYVERDPWLARRMLGFGASEALVLLVALGWASEDDLASYQRPRVNKIATKGLAPTARLWLEKAGLRRPLSAKAAAAEGTRRERELAEQTRKLLEHGQLRGDAGGIDPRSLVYCEDAIPRELLPLVDREAHRLTCTPDAWARDSLGALVPVELKCSVRPYTDTPARHRWQVMTQIAVMDAPFGVLVEGQGWAATWAGDGAVHATVIRRDEEAVRMLRAAAADGWARVEAVRAEYEQRRAA